MSLAVSVELARIVFGDEAARRRAVEDQSGAGPPHSKEDQSGAGRPHSREILLVSESGLSTGSDLRRLQALGFSAFLIGETLMRAHVPGRDAA